MREALLKVLGSISKLLRGQTEILANIELFLHKVVFPDTKSDNPILKMTAMWTFGRYAKVMTFTDINSTVSAANEIFVNLNSSELPLAVASAVSLSHFLKSQPSIVDVVRPGLEDVLKAILHLMDKIDFDKLVKALQVIVIEFDKEIVPHAYNLCNKLGAAFLRLA